MFSLASAVVGLALAVIAPVTSFAQTTADCGAPTSRIKHLPPLSIDILREDGILGSKLTQIEFTMIEARTHDCNLAWSFVLGYNVYNYWRAGESPGANAVVFISFYSQGRDIRHDVMQLWVPLHFCGPIGQPDGVYFQMRGELRENLFDSVDEIRLSATRMRGTLVNCFP